VENLSLILSTEADLTVKSFTVRETLSSPFEVEVVAIAPADNLPFEQIVGRKATFRAASPWGEGPPRTWTGVLHRVEQIDAEPSGATTYALHLGPALWRLSRRTNCRIFQHMSVPDIAIALLAEYEIVPVLRLDRAAFPRHEYRVQYGETDLAFLSRLLEEAGIAYAFEEPPPPESAEDEAAFLADPPYTLVVLAEDATRREPRATSPEYWNTKDLPNDREAVSQVRAAREVTTGRATIRDFDFRKRPKHKLLMSAAAASETEDRLEVYEYAPGAFVIEPTGGEARVDEREAQSRVDRALASRRGGRFAITYRSNLIDLAPGVVFSIHGHPHPDLGDKRALLVIAQTIQGTRDGEWIVTGAATFGDEAHRPALVTPRPKIAGVQSAFVVGPEGEEIHTDAMGRVRVELHWDREGKSDERSSCFVRVSQAWAGPGYGIVAVPRVGEEVLVSFFDGDPDQPVIVGRVHNGTAPPPQALPANKTKTIWRTNSTPGGGGYNEIALDDRKGEELVAMRAERDYERTILREERVTIGASLTTAIGDSEARDVKLDQSITIGGSRAVSIAGTDSLHVGESLSIDLGGNAGGTFSKDKKIILSTGEASLVLDGPNLYIDAKAIVSVRAGDTLTLSGGDVSIDGLPSIKLNSSQASPPAISLLNGLLQSVNLQLPPGAPPLDYLSQLVSSPLLDPGQAPGELSIPPDVEAQLMTARNKILAGVEEITSKIEDLPNEIGQDVLPEVEAARSWANAKIEEARAWVEKAKARVAAEIQKWKAELASLKAKLETAAQEIRDKVMAAVKQVQDKITALRDRAREMIQKVKDTIQSYKDQLKAKWDELRAQAIEFRNKVVGPFEEIRNSIKSLVQQVKDTVNEFKETVTGIVNDVKSTIKEVKDTIQKIKDDVKDLFGLKSAFKEAKQEVQDAIDGVKEAWNDAKQEAKDAVNEVKDAWDSVFHSGSNNAVPDAPGFQAPPGNVGGGSGFHAPGGSGGSLHIPGQGAQAGQGHGFHIPGQGGQAGSGAAHNLHANAGHALHGAKGAPHIDVQHGAASTLGKAHSLSAHGNAPQMQGGFDLQKAVAQGGSAAQENGSAGSSIGRAVGQTAQSAQGASDVMLKNPLHGSTVVTRAGGFTPDSLVDAVNGAQTPTLLQSPGEGQLLILRTQKAAALSSPDFTQAFVDGQMDGLSSSDAFAAALQQKGYLVYERPWDSWLTTLLKKAVL